jgi:hypothetical protein
VQIEAAPDFARLNSHHRIFSSGISRRALKNIGPNRPFLQAIRVTVQLIENYVLEDLLAAIRAFEVPARQDALQLLKNTQALTQFLIW